MDVVVDFPPADNVELKEPEELDADGRYRCQPPNCPDFLRAKLTSDAGLAAGQKNNVLAGILFGIGGSLLLVPLGYLGQRLWAYGSNS
jgi:hypothetical protein